MTWTTVKIGWDGKPWAWFDLRVVADLAEVQRLYLRWYTPDANMPAAFWYSLIKPKSTKIGAMIVSWESTRQQVLHECLHAASRLYRVKIAPTGLNLGVTEEWPGTYETNPEEVFADLVGTVSDAVLSKIESLPEFKGWPTVE